MTRTMKCTGRLGRVKGYNLRCLSLCFIFVLFFILLTSDNFFYVKDTEPKARIQESSCNTHLFLTHLKTKPSISNSMEPLYEVNHSETLLKDMHKNRYNGIENKKQTTGNKIASNQTKAIDTEPKARIQESSCNIRLILTHLKTKPSISYGMEPLYEVVQVRNGSETLLKDLHKSRYNSLENGKQTYKIASIQTSAILTDKKIVIILAYYRSGSTLTGSLFQEYPGSFYVFEPLRAIIDHFEEARKRNQTQMTFRYVDGNRSYKVSEEEIFSIAMDTVNNWLTCKLGSLDQESLTDPFHTSFTKLMKQYSICIKSKKNSKEGKLRKGNDTSFDRSYSTDMCLENAITLCQKAPVVILKFVRLEMKALESLLPLYPNMKIIHLVRDPRAVMNSEVNSPAIPPVCYESRIRYHCNDTWNNLKSSKSILYKYPDRLKIVYYEDIAENPEKVSKEMVDFTGLQFIEGMRSYIINKTSSPNANDACRSCVDRKDSRKTANKWREELPFNYSQMTFRLCQQSNAVLGFLPFSANEMQKNLKIPSRKIVDLNKQFIDKELP